MSTEMIDVPGRILSYRDAGYDTVTARRMAMEDVTTAAAAILKEDYANPVSVEIESLEPIPCSNAEMDRAEEEYELAYNHHAIMGACRAHGISTNDINYRLSAAIQNSLHAKNIGSEVMLKMEAVHASGVSARMLTVHMEDAAGQSVKNIWQKLKQAFVNTFNRIRTWYVKAFDATARLGKKATALKATAEGKQGVPAQPFEFNGLKQLAINGKPPEPAQLVAVVANMTAITQGVMGKTSASYTAIVEKMDNALKELVQQAEAQAPAPAANAQPGAQGNQGQNQGGTTTTAPTPSNANAGGQANADFTLNGDNKFVAAIKNEMTALQQVFGASLQEWTDFRNDKRFAAIGAADSQTTVKVYKTKEPLPGDKMFVVSIPDASTTAGAVKDFKMAFGGTVEFILEKPRDLQDSATFKALNQAQVVNICDSVIDACKAGLDYKLLFAGREKSVQALEKQLDVTVNQADKLQGQALTYVKANVSAATTIVGKINSTEGSWFRYAMGVFGKAIDLAQASLNQVQ